MGLSDSALNMQGEILDLVLLEKTACLRRDVFELASWGSRVVLS